MSHWSEECLSSLDSKELKALCGHRNLQTEARHKKTRKERMNLLLNCKSEPNYDKLYKSELQLEMKARGLKIQSSHKVKQLKHILNNFTVSFFYIPYITLYGIKDVVVMKQLMV